MVNGHRKNACPKMDRCVISLSVMDKVIKFKNQCQLLFALLFLFLYHSDYAALNPSELGQFI